MSTAPGKAVTLTATFLDSPGGNPVDPSAVSVQIERNGSVVAGPFTPNHNDVGLYSFNWTVPSNAVLGDYAAQWNATISGSPRTAYELFTVSAPVSGPVTLSTDEVADWLGNTRPTNTAQLDACTEAAVAWVNAHTDESMAPYATRKLGTKMLAARLYSRKDSANGLVAFESFGATYIARYDFDITNMLGLNTIVVG